MGTSRQAIERNSYKALTCTVVIISFNVCCIFIFIESPIQYSKHSNRNAVLAIRDNVSNFQKLGSRVFTEGGLKQGYSNYKYITLMKPWKLESSLFTEIDAFLQTNEQVDIFLLSHGNTMVELFSRLDKNQRRKIRLVYNTGCGNASQAEIWMSLGAKSYISHEAKESFSPIFYFFFFRQWLFGMSLNDSLLIANQRQEPIIKLISFFGTRAEFINSKATLFGDPDLKIHANKE